MTNSSEVCANCGKTREEHFYRMGQLNSHFPYCNGRVTDINNNPQFTPQKTNSLTDEDENIIAEERLEMSKDTQTPLTLKDKEFFNEDYSYPVLLSDDIKESLKRLRDEIRKDSRIIDKAEMVSVNCVFTQIDEIMGVFD